MRSGCVVERRCLAYVAKPFFGTIHESRRRADSYLHVVPGPMAACGPCFHTILLFAYALAVPASHLENARLAVLMDVWGDAFDELLEDEALPPVAWLAEKQDRTNEDAPEIASNSNRT